MTPSQLPVDLRAQQIIAAFYRAGYPIAEIADALGLTRTACQDLLAAMRDAGWTLRRPRGTHERIQVDNDFLRERYLQRRAQARRRGERLSLSELARTAGLVRPGREPDPTLGRALGLEPHEVEAHEIRPRPARFTAPRHGLPVIAAREDPVTVTDAERPAVAA